MKFNFEKLDKQPYSLLYIHIDFNIINPLFLIFRLWYKTKGYKKRYLIQKQSKYRGRGEWAVFRDGEQITIGMSYEDTIDWRETFGKYSYGKRL